MEGITTTIQKTRALSPTQGEEKMRALAATGDMDSVLVPGTYASAMRDAGDVMAGVLKWLSELDRGWWHPDVNEHRMSAELKAIVEAWESRQ